MTGLKCGLEQIVGKIPTILKLWTESNLGKFLLFEEYKF